MLGTIKFVDKSVNDNSPRRLHHCDVIASHNGCGVPTGVPHSEVELQTEFKSFIAAHLGSNTNQHTDWILGSTCIKSSRSVYAPHLVQSVRLLLFKYRGGDNAHWISKIKMAATVVQWELCGTNVLGNIANLWVSCYNGNNDRSAWVLFVQHHREQGEWLRRTLTTLGFWLHHSPCSLGCGRTTPSQPGHYPPNTNTEFIVSFRKYISGVSIKWLIQLSHAAKIQVMMISW